ncbi:hypothetical protein [Anaeromicropila herbilytica]|uniref:Uncharacterized protein n=1 Tax=Anaeromicropila herbilytica TaxID=2785025 RepID=A0A7R7IBW9_9FIRM|nr:hypothetical protein [Anaeromicropila herbilytica]BCN30022.1 hypothetical protein bsdtb5_13170 [Anaeromicropila herbilytica]
MGIFKLFKKKKVQNNKLIDNKTLGEKSSNQELVEDMNQNTMVEETEDDDILDRIDDWASYLNGQSDRIKESIKQVEDTKVEYQLVSSYLGDMQKIEMIPKEQRDNLDDAARHIITLARDRSKYQNNGIKIADKQFRNIENYEEEMPNEIKKMKENESFHTLIKNDMRHLEGEKGELRYQKEEVIKKQRFLKALAIVTSIMVLGLLTLLLMIAKTFQTDIQTPFLLTILMAALSSFYIFYEARRNAIMMKVIEKKQNKAIDLLNSVKIKMINNTSVLDYSYSKFMVHNSKELERIWEKYVKAKDEARRYEKNTELLNFYNETLIKELKKYNINDPEIWIYQAIAIIDQKEMQEVRHRLNVRRQKLRERIDYNNKVKEHCLMNIEGLIKKNPHLRPQIEELLVKNNITVVSID